MDERLMETISLIEEGKHEEGLLKLEKLSQEDDDELKRTISEIYYDLGLVDRALQLVEDLMFRYPDHGELFAFAAECYSELGQEDEAIDMLTEIKKEDPAFVQAQLLLADIYQNEGLEEVAEQKLLQAESLRPEDLILQLGLGEFYLSRGNYLQCIPYFKKVIHSDNKLDTESLNPHLRLAEAYSATGQFEDAMSLYKQGIEKEENIEGLFGYGYTAMQIEDYETAAKQLGRLKELDPNYTTLFPYLARALRAIGKKEEAIRVLKEGISKDEFNEELYLEMAQTQFILGNKEEGKGFLEKVIAINPSNITAVKELLLYFHGSEDYEGVIQLVSFLEDYGEHDPMFERFRGKALYEEDDLEGAIKAYELALADMPEHEDLLEEAGYAYLEAGKNELGKHCLERLLSLNPQRFDIEERLLLLNDQ